jgi:hypothetical protein
MLYLDNVEKQRSITIHFYQNYSEITKYQEGYKQACRLEAAFKCDSGFCRSMNTV